MSWAALILPGTELAGAAGKALIAAAKKAIANVVERELRKGAEAAAIKAAAEQTAKETLMYAAAERVFSAADLGIFKEATQIYRSPNLDKIRQAFTAGKEATVEIGGYTLHYVPNGPFSGFSLASWGKEFAIGPEAFTSQLEFAKTIAQESYRIATLEGTATPSLATDLTKLAEAFADKAGPILISGGK